MREEIQGDKVKVYLNDHGVYIFKPKTWSVLKKIIDRSNTAPAVH